ncbi:MAG: AMP-binding protein [Micromonosporaceae bacterium]|nr:AMP-binding protein [Micromonosporaceae bacterium]
MGLTSRTVAVDQCDDASEPPDPDRRPAPSDLIYGYYTSGSTGAPKCAINRHRGLVNRLTAMSRRFGDGADHITLQNSRSTFDSAMWQVLWPLTSGGQVVLPHRDGILDLEQTATTIGRYGVTITDFVPSVLAALVSLLEVRADLRESVSCLRRMLIGGEAANPSVVHRLRALLPELRITNTYGPTECSIGSVFHEVSADDVDRIPLGRPIDNTAAILLDEQRRPVPPGAVGEIWLGGECVGAGYLGDPERTARAFIPNPFPEIGSELLYRTGDLATTDDAGLLQFVGRGDDQVKVGGVRIELGDIDNALASHPLVGNAVTVVLGDGENRTLVGCVSPRSGDEPPDLRELRQHAARRLPAEVAPHRVVVLESLPVNQNGKADRRALKQLLAKAVDNEEDFVAPADALEELIATAWRRVLDVSRVSATAPFAEYGGTSLSGIQVAAALSAELARTVRPRDLIVATTVREQADLLRGGESSVSTETEEHAHIGRDAQWRPPPLAPWRADHLLVTGATGFVGAHLLAELLRLSDARVSCLVRARDPGDAVHRLARTLDSYQLASASRDLLAGIVSGRVEAVAGDLGQPDLGMTQDACDRLASSADAVVHAGALVNLVAGYLAHRPANVVGVQELIRLAAAGRGSRLHVLSTLSIFPTSGADTAPITERQFPSPSGLPSDGYSRSKYVAERLLANAREHGVSSVVYRLGEVWPHRELAVANPASLAHTLLYACARTGCAFPTEAAIDVTPVDVVSRFVAGCAIGELDPPDGTLHVLWPAPLRFAAAFGALAQRGRLERVGYPEFRRRLEALALAPDPDPRLARLSVLLPPAGRGDAAPPEFDQMFTPGGGHFDCEGFTRHAAALPQAAPAPDGLNGVSGYLARLSAGHEPAFPGHDPAFPGGPSDEQRTDGVHRGRQPRGAVLDLAGRPRGSGGLA